MKQLLQHLRTGELELAEVPVAQPEPRSGPDPEPREPDLRRHGADAGRNRVRAASSCWTVAQLLSNNAHRMRSNRHFERAPLEQIAGFLERHPAVIQALVGPRQVGKTTIAKQLMKRTALPSVYASADSPLPPGPEWIETQWKRAEIEAASAHGPVLLVLDEIQKVQGWSETVKHLWDAQPQENRTVRLLLLGSSSLLLQSGLSESMSGRFFLHRCPHWSFPESHKAFGWSLDEWIFFGGYPGAAEFADNLDHWKQYVMDSLIETVLARDVLQMQRVAKPALLRHLFLLAAAYPSQILSYNKMLGQLQDAGNTTTLAHYLTLLEAAFLVSGLPAFSKGEIRKRASSPKLILWNNALVNSLSPASFPDVLGDAGRWGRLVENAVGAHLLNGLPAAAYRVSYWRKAGQEVDFVVEHETGLWGVEVKSGRPRKTTGIDRFRTRYPESKVLIVGGGGIPLEVFFDTPPTALFDS